MMFVSIVGHASFHTAGPSGPSMSERSKGFLAIGAWRGSVSAAATGGDGATTSVKERRRVWIEESRRGCSGRRCERRRVTEMEWKQMIVP